MNTPKSVWIIFDDIGEPYVFNVKEDAVKYYNTRKQNDGDIYKTFWAISEPMEFKISS